MEHAWVMTGATSVDAISPTQYNFKVIIYVFILFTEFVLCLSRAVANSRWLILYN